MEEWRSVLGYEGYYDISNFGRVRSLDRMCYAGGGRFRCVKPKILKLRDNGRGYLAVNLYDDNGPKRYKIARLVLAAFIGPCPKGMESCHNNGNKRNDKLENLRWDTRQANAQDKIIHGTTTRGELDVASKLTEVEVIEIKEVLLGNSLKGQGRRLAERFGVSEATISFIRSGKRWAWLAACGG